MLFEEPAPLLLGEKWDKEIKKGRLLICGVMNGSVAVIAKKASGISTPPPQGLKSHASVRVPLGLI
jgi:hypothetical protein